MSVKENVIPLKNLQHFSLKNDEEFVEAIQRKTYEYIVFLNQIMMEEDVDKESSNYLLNTFNLEELVYWDLDEWKKNKDGLVLQGQPLKYFFERYAAARDNYSSNFSSEEEEKLSEYVMKIEKKLVHLTMTEKTGF